MYYIFKKDFIGNYIPCFATQSPVVATHFMQNSVDDVCCMQVKGNKKTIIPL